MASVVSPPAISKCLPITINPGNLLPSLVRPKLQAKIQLVHLSLHEQFDITFANDWF